jgi:hypothetical protein
MLPDVEAKIVAVACKVPHNFIRENSSEDSDFAWFAFDPHFFPTILEQYNQLHWLVRLWTLVPPPWMFFVLSWPWLLLLLGTGIK